MTIAADLLALAKRVESRIELPPVDRLLVPPRAPDPGIEGEFGVLLLADGSAGFFFALLGDTLSRLHEEIRRPGAAGGSPVALAAHIASADPALRAVALGAHSAIAQHLFRRAGLALETAVNALGGGQFTATDHVGMVGLFPSLAARLRARGIRLTVLELRAEKVQREGTFEVTLDPARLRDCNTVLCTASTLINGTLDAVLGHVSAAQRVALIGPSAGCLPDPLFARGVHVLGGAAVADPQALAVRLERRERWGDAVRRYTLDARGYPGVEALLQRA